MKLKEYNTKEQRAFEVLVRQALIGEAINYDDLAKEIGVQPNSMEPLLKKVETDLGELGNELKTELPPIRAIAVDQKATASEEDIDLKKRQRAVFDYKGWIRVLKEVDPSLPIYSIARVINRITENERKAAGGPSSQIQGATLAYLQAYRKKINNLQSGPDIIFTESALQKAIRNFHKRYPDAKPPHTQYDYGHTRYAFHRGGLAELQFNIGYYDRSMSRSHIRFAFAFSLQRNQSLTDVTVLYPYIKHYNNYIREHGQEYADLDLQHWDKDPTDRGRRIMRNSLEIVEGQKWEGNSIFIGIIQPIDNIDIEEALKAMNRLMPLWLYVMSEGKPEEISANINHPQAFHFSPGKPNSGTYITEANIAKAKRDIELRHKLMQEILYEQLIKEHGKENVAPEQRVSSGGNADIMVQVKNNRHHIYEIKTEDTARACIREALGQLLEYSLWSSPEGEGCPDMERMIVVGEPNITEEGKKYLARLNQRFPALLEYRSVSVESPK